MKRKKASRKTRKTPAAVAVKPIRPPYSLSRIGCTLVLDSVNGGFRRAVPADFAGQRHNFRNLPPHAMQAVERTATGEIRLAKSVPTTTVRGVPLPPDFEEAVEHYAGDTFRFFCGEVEDTISENRELLELVRGSLECAFRDGFYLALVHHSDDLKQTAKAAPLLEGLRRGRRVGAETNKRKAKATRTAIRKRFRELRKQGFSMEDARNDLAREYGKSFRQIERDTRGLS